MKNPRVAHIDEVMSHCIHCGMCLPVCPTYSLTSREESSPRGRIRLMKYVHEGTLDPGGGFAEEMYFCLDCQACQTACPAGVRYGDLVEDARRLIADRGCEPRSVRRLKSLFLGVIGSKRRLRQAAAVFRFYQRSGLRDAVDESEVLSLFSDRLARKHALLPRVDRAAFDDDLPEFFPSEGPSRGTVGFLTGCIMNVAFGDVHRDAIRVLQLSGFDVIVPRGQGCCGSLHGHNGETEAGKVLARSLIDAFRSHRIDALVIDSAGCGAFIKEYGELLADDPDYAPAARDLSQKTKDFTEFLDQAGIPDPPRRLDLRVTIHDACHLVHTQKISEQPRRLIRKIRGIEFVELPESTWCCGSAGIYNVLRPDDAAKFLERKIGNLKETEAAVVVTGNPGCHLQILYGIKRAGLAMDVMHPATLLRKAFE